MREIIQRVFSQKQAPLALVLFGDKDVRRLIVQEVGKKIQDDVRVLPEPVDQLSSIIALADFASDSECQDIVRILYRHSADTDILPAISRHRGRELGEHCLIGLSLFYQAMEQRFLQYGAPPPYYYRLAGQKAFEISGAKEIASHFSRWETFLSDQFI